MHIVEALVPRLVGLGINIHVLLYGSKLIL